MIHVNDRLEFHLSTKGTSYIMKVLESKHLGTLYYGKRIREKKSYESLYQNYNIILGSSTDYSKETKHFTLDSTMLEVATYGKGDYREPSLSLVFEDQSRVSDFRYVSHAIHDGKPTLEGLPHTFCHNDDVQTLEITLYDEVVDVYLTLSYSAFYERDVIARSMRITNGDQAAVLIEKAMSFNLDFHDSDFDMITLDGKWIKERHIHTRKLEQGTFMIDSKKAVSSANHNPFIGLKRKNTDEMMGECYGFGLVYSGSHQGLVEVNPHSIARVQMGINPFDFAWRLECGASFQTPEVLMTYSYSGLNGMSQHFHDVINHNLVSPLWQGRERPILINNWEATFFDFDERKLMRMAKEAVNLGMELFVLDDGWFGARDDDTTSLGDWFENVKKLPHGLEGLSKKIHDLGLQFGLWVEPEMVNEESELYREHPDWAIKLPNREPSVGRYQLMLDLANPEVVDHLYHTLKDIFTRAEVQYVKWDMNRNISDLYSGALPRERQRELCHRYTLGLYDLLGRLKEDFKHVLFESCASGGNRFDLGMLYYMPQTWTSDNTDALERVSIQYGTSMVYPISTMGAHVSGSPSQQVLRNTPLETRFNVAAFGLLGYELDITKLTNFEKKVIKKQIEFYKRYRKLLQFGTFYRLKSPFEENQALWMVVSEDQEEALLGYYQRLQAPNEGFESLRMAGLDTDRCYHVKTREQFMNIRAFGELINEASPLKIQANSIIHTLISNNYLFGTEVEEVAAYGDELMHAGLLPYHQFIGNGYNDQIRHIGDFGSRLYTIEANNDA